MRWIPRNLYSGRKLHRRSQQPKQFLHQQKLNFIRNRFFLEYFQSFHVTTNTNVSARMVFNLLSSVFFFTNTPSELSACFVFLFSSTFNSPTPAAERWKRVWVSKRDGDNEQLEEGFLRFTSNRFGETFSIENHFEIFDFKRLQNTLEPWRWNENFFLLMCSITVSTTERRKIDVLNQCSTSTRCIERVIVDAFTTTIAYTTV